MPESYEYKPFPGRKGKVKNVGGTESSERTGTFEVDKRHYVVPTLVFDEEKPKQLKGFEPIERAQKIGLDKFPSFSTADEANKYAAWRTGYKGKMSLKEKMKGKKLGQ